MAQYSTRRFLSKSVCKRCLIGKPLAHCSLAPFAHCLTRTSRSLAAIGQVIHIICYNVHILTYTSAPSFTLFDAEPKGWMSHSHLCITDRFVEKREKPLDHSCLVVGKGLMHWSFLYNTLIAHAIHLHAKTNRGYVGFACISAPSLAIP